MNKIILLVVLYLFAVIYTYLTGGMVRILRNYRDTHGTPRKGWLWVAAAFEASSYAAIIVYVNLFLDFEKGLFEMLMQSVPGVIILAVVYGGTTHWLSKRFRVSVGPKEVRSK